MDDYCTVGVIMSVIVPVKTYTPLYCLTFFTLFISTTILSVYIDEIFLLIFTDEVSDRKFWYVKIIAIYQQETLIYISICIR